MIYTTLYHLMACGVQCRIIRCWFKSEEVSYFQKMSVITLTILCILFNFIQFTNIQVEIVLPVLFWIRLIIIFQRDKQRAM